MSLLLPLVFAPLACVAIADLKNRNLLKWLALGVLCPFVALPAILVAPAESAS